MVVCVYRSSSLAPADAVFKGMGIEGVGLR